LTTKNLTGMLAKKMPRETGTARTKGETLFQLFFALIQWPWLLKSLYGGNKAEKNAVLERINLEQDALPHLGSWKADTYLLHRIVDEIEVRQPKNVVELGSGVTSLVIAKALSLHGGGHLYSYDQYEPFVEQMGIWLAEHHLSASFSHAPLNFRDQARPTPSNDRRTSIDRTNPPRHNVSGFHKAKVSGVGIANTGVPEMADVSGV